MNRVFFKVGNSVCVSIPKKVCLKFGWVVGQPVSFIVDRKEKSITFCKKWSQSGERIKDVDEARVLKILRKGHPRDLSKEDVELCFAWFKKCREDLNAQYLPGLPKYKEVRQKLEATGLCADVKEKLDALSLMEWKFKRKLNRVEF